MDDNLPICDDNVNENDDVNKDDNDDVSFNNDDEDLDVY
jgi:hypothetical protein